jgi:hypothetical protein
MEISRRNQSSHRGRVQNHGGGNLWREPYSQFLEIRYSLKETQQKKKKRKKSIFKIRRKGRK